LLPGGIEDLDKYRKHAKNPLTNKGALGQIIWLFFFYILESFTYGIDIKRLKLASGFYIEMLT
jgi:hypothetical protein